MSIERKFGGGVAWMAAGNWIEQGINFAVFVLLARILGAEIFGLLAMAAAFVLLSEFLVRESLSDFLIARATPDKAHFDATFWLLAGLGAGLFLLLQIGAGPVAALYGEPQVTSLIRALSPTVLMIALTAVPVAILRRELRFATLSLRAIAGVVIGGIVAVFMALNGYGVWSLAGQRLAQVFINVVMAWAAVSWRPQFAISVQHSKDVVRFGGAVLGLRMAELAATQVPSVIIGATHGPAVLGLFSMAWRLVEIGSFLIVTPLRMVSQPAFAALSRQGENATQLLVNISKLSGLVAFAAFGGLAVLAEPLIEWLFGAQWVGAAPALSVLSIYGAYLCIEKINQAFCLAAGQAQATTIVAWAELGLASLLVWLAAPWGLEIMAAGMVLSFLLFWPLRYFVVARLAKVGPFSLMRVHAKPLLATGGMILAVAAVILNLDSPLPRTQVLVGTVVGGAVMFALTLLTMRPRLKLLTSFFGKPLTDNRETE